MNSTLTLPFSHFVENCQARIIQLTEHYLQKNAAPSLLLQDAMSYSVLNGGKRIRPLLVYGTGTLLGISLEELDAPACAVEFCHAYSLIHDDLPAMDNADLRRGKPSCHKAFDEAIAILAGDALQTIAFQILAQHPANLSAEQRIAMVSILAETSGPEGMAGGQALDLRTKPHSLKDLVLLYRLKTGALLSACVKMATCCAPSIDADTQNALEIYADNIGLAFQIQDDLLDIEAETTTGKPQGLDALNDKWTYPRIAGIDATREKIDELFEISLLAIKPFGEKATILKNLAKFLLQRKN